MASLFGFVRSFLNSFLVCCLLFSAASVLAQSTLGAIEPILKGCRSKEESAAVAKSWNEAGAMAAAHFEWYVISPLFASIQTTIFQTLASLVFAL